jgi:cytidyltransferase-like protein
MNKKVFVSGCFDMLHSGHVAFFKEASEYGDLYVGIGSDSTIQKLKGRTTINTDIERLFMVKSIKYVKDAWINSGEGLIDFKDEFVMLKPDIFFVNDDGFTPDKIKICNDTGTELIVSKRIPHDGLPARSTTELRSICNIPYRLDLAGGWLDQPFVSKYCPGNVITISVYPDYNFNDRSGMSSSTRKKAIELWKTNIPNDDKEILAKTLFGFENIPGTKIISGSQDSIGIIYPGVNRLYYEKEKYWPRLEKAYFLSDLEKWIEDTFDINTTGFYEWILDCQYIERRYWERVWEYHIEDETFRKTKANKNIMQINEILRQLYKVKIMPIFIDYYKDYNDRD